MSNELDKHISERLRHYESAVDAEAIWDAVKPPRRRRFGFWLFLFLGGITLAGGTWWIWKQNHVSHKNAVVIEPDESAIQKEHSSHQTYRKDKTMPNSGIPSDSITYADNSSFPSQSNEGLNEYVQKDNSSNAGIKQANESLTDYKMLTQLPPKTSGGTLENKYIIPKPSINHTPGGNTIGTVDSVQQKQKGFTPSTPEEKKYEKNVHQATVDSSLLTPINQSLPTLLGFIEESIPKVENKMANNDKDLLLPPKEKSLWSIQTDIAYLIIDRELDTKDSAKIWLDNRLATESILEAWSFDAGLSYSIHKDIRLRAGLGYTQVNTVFKYDNTTIKRDSVEGLQMLVYNTDNTVDSIFGPTGRSEITRRQLETYNSFRQIELPILISYESQWKKLSIIVEAGARFRFYRSWEGQAIDRFGKLVSLEDQDWYRNNIGVSWQGSLQLGYTVTPQLQVRIGGTIRYSPTKFSKPDRALNENYQLSGLQLGLRYQLH
jgi:hypothetical protein